MKRDKNKTKVLFVRPRYPDGQREVLALFPEQSEGTKYIGFGLPLVRLIGSYAHMGQHSSACETFLRRVKAKPEEYAPLKRELEGLGYNLEVLN